MTSTYDSVQQKLSLIQNDPKIFAKYFCGYSLQRLFNEKFQDHRVSVGSITLGIENDDTPNQPGFFRQYLYFGASPMHYRIGYVQYYCTDSRTCLSVENVLMDYGETVYYQMLQ